MMRLRSGSKNRAGGVFREVQEYYSSFSVIELSAAVSGVERQSMPVQLSGNKILQPFQSADIVRPIFFDPPAAVSATRQRELFRRCFGRSPPRIRVVSPHRHESSRSRASPVSQTFQRRDRPYPAPGSGFAAMAHADEIDDSHEPSGKLTFAAARDFPRMSSPAFLAMKCRRTMVEDAALRRPRHRAPRA